jgi:hypothetical protein
MKSSGDLASGETFADQLKHLEFAIAKLLDRRTLRRSCPPEKISRMCADILSLT